MSDINCLPISDTPIFSRGHISLCAVIWAKLSRFNINNDSHWYNVDTFKVSTGKSETYRVYNNKQTMKIQKILIFEKVLDQQWNLTTFEENQWGPVRPNSASGSSLWRCLSELWCQRKFQLWFRKSGGFRNFKLSPEQTTLSVRWWIS